MALAGSRSVRYARYAALRDRIAALSPDALVELSGLFIVGRNSLGRSRRTSMAEVIKQGRYYVQKPEAPEMIAGKKHCLREYLHDGLVAVGIEPGFAV